MTTAIIRELCTKKALYWTNHVDTRLAERGIRRDDILNVLMTGEIIEQYKDDQPYPSCLVLGRTAAAKYIHVVCGTDGQALWLITAYYPSREKWSADYKTRIGTSNEALGPKFPGGK
ncbi:hypothetical protein FACS1894106_1720 [Spirochaetia bacterium]|nr:hypothetical protein FACS1894106_1720 [Spirochaetia bacterium]